MEYANGGGHHYEGEKGAERLVCSEMPNGIIQHLGGEQGEEGAEGVGRRRLRVRVAQHEAEALENLRQEQHAISTPSARAQHALRIRGHCPAICGERERRLNATREAILPGSGSSTRQGSAVALVVGVRDTLPHRSARAAPPRLR